MKKLQLLLLTLLIPFLGFTQTQINVEFLFDGSIPTIELYTLSYNNFKNLVQSPILLKTNLSEYLDQFRIITDDISIKGGYIINFGVFFDVVSDKTSNKSEVKLRCINKIKEYFLIDKMQFKQTIHTSELEYELMGLEGVRGINYIRLGQGASSTDLGEYFTTPLYGKTGIPGQETYIGNNTDPNYGWFYDFTQFYGDTPLAGDGVILPSVEPAVFELKEPNKNVKGIVR